MSPKKGPLYATLGPRLPRNCIPKNKALEDLLNDFSRCRAHLLYFSSFPSTPCDYVLARPARRSSARHRRPIVHISDQGYQTTTSLSMYKRPFDLFYYHHTSSYGLRTAFWSMQAAKTMPLVQVQLFLIALWKRSSYSSPLLHLLWIAVFVIWMLSRLCANLPLMGTRPHVFGDSHQLPCFMLYPAI